MKPNATLALRGYMWAWITVASLILAGLVAGGLLLLASWLEKHRLPFTADLLNYCLAAAVVYHSDDVSADEHPTEDAAIAGGKR